MPAWGPPHILPDAVESGQYSPEAVSRPLLALDTADSRRSAAIVDLRHGVTVC